MEGRCTTVVLTRNRSLVTVTVGPKWLRLFRQKWMTTTTVTPAAYPLRVTMTMTTEATHEGLGGG